MTRWCSEPGCACFRLPLSALANEPTARARRSSTSATSSSVASFTRLRSVRFSAPPRSAGRTSRRLRLPQRIAPASASSSAATPRCGGPHRAGSDLRRVAGAPSEPDSATRAIDITPIYGVVFQRITGAREAGSGAHHEDLPAGCRHHDRDACWERCARSRRKRCHSGVRQCREHSREEAVQGEQRRKVFDFEGTVYDIKDEKVLDIEIDSGNYATVMFKKNVGDEVAKDQRVRFRGLLVRIGTGILVSHQIKNAVMK